MCYNRAEVWASRERACEFYLEATLACEGCEGDRYANVLADLLSGEAVCHDGVTQFLTQETEYR